MKGLSPSSPSHPLPLLLVCWYHSPGRVWIQSAAMLSWDTPKFVTLPPPEPTFPSVHTGTKRKPSPRWVAPHSFPSSGADSRFLRSLFPPRRLVFLRAVADFKLSCTCCSVARSPPTETRKTGTKLNCEGGRLSAKNVNYSVFTAL